MRYWIDMFSHCMYSVVVILLLLLFLFASNVVTIRFAGLFIGLALLLLPYLICTSY